MRLYRSVAKTAAKALGRRVAVAQLVFLASLLLGGSVPAAAPNPFEAHTSDEVRRLAIRGIPFDKMPPAAQSRVKAVVSGRTVFRRLPVRVVDCDPEMYLFLLRHPDVVVNVWQVLGVTQLEARQTAQGKFDIADHAGTNGTLEILYQSSDTHVVLAEGRYEGPWSVRATKGKVLLVIRSGYVHEADGRHYVTTRLDSFLSLDAGAAELLAKVLQPVVGKVADSNFAQSVAFLGSLSRTAEVNPQGVERLSKKLQDVPVSSRETLALIAQRLGAEFAAASGEGEGEAGKEAAAPAASQPRHASSPPHLADRPHAAQE